MKKRVLAVGLALCMMLCLLPVSAVAMEPGWDVSDIYLESEYYQNLQQLELTGEWRTDLVNVALTQVGYHEGDSKVDYAGGNTEGWLNCMEYSSVYYGMDAQWCAMFISWCARQAGIPWYAINNAAGAFADGYGGTSASGFHISSYSKNNHTPIVGDLVFFSSTGWGTNHVGIVAGLSDTGIYVVEGNSLNAVRLKYYDYDDEYIARYGVYAGLEDESPYIPLNYSKLQFVFSEGVHGHMPDGDEYGFDKLLAMHGRVFTLPVNGFEREGFALQGYFVQRADGAWYCGDDGWLTEEELEEQERLPQVLTDGISWRFDQQWSACGDLTLYCVWTTESGGHRYDSALPARFLLDSSGWSNPFGDLFENQWYYNTVRAACQAGLISGSSRFRAGDAATRAEFVSMLYRAAGMPELPETVEGFADVSEDYWARDAILWARYSGLVQGVGDNLFLPENAMSRQEMVTMLYRWLGEDAELICDETYADVDTVSAWAQNAMGWATAQGLITGMETEAGLCLCPLDTTSRAQTVTVALRVLERLGGAELPGEAQ